MESEKKFENKKKGQDETQETVSLDQLILCKTYPDAAAVFTAEYKSLDSIKDECLIVIDTNVLVIPFRTGSKSLEEIDRTYNRLVGEKRLYIPAQVAREFARLRADILKDVHSAMHTQANDVQALKVTNYPLLNNDPDFLKAVEIQKDINKKIKEMRDEFKKVVEKIKAWTWDDPVSLLYQ